MTVPRSFAKHAARMTFPNSVFLRPISSTTASTTATEVVERATPASQLDMAVQRRTYWATGVRPRNGLEKPTSPAAVVSFHFARKITESSSAPARKVSTLAPVPAKKVIHSVFAARPAGSTTAPIMSCATVPTTVSNKAVEILSQIARKVAMRANPTQIEASARTFGASALASAFVRRFSSKT